MLEEGCVLLGVERELTCFAHNQLEMSVCRSAEHWRQRGKFCVVKEGDANTRYFHARASQGYRRNWAQELEVDGETVVSDDGKAAALFRFYHDLLGQERAC
jgi:hypothetical protein